MSDITIQFPSSVPESEVSRDFIQGMVNRMAFSFFKYGRVQDAYPHKVNAIESLRDRLKLYEETGNTEFLMDAANFAMIESMHPAHPAAYFSAEESSLSPGRVWNGGERSQLSNGRGPSQGEKPAEK